MHPLENIEINYTTAKKIKSLPDCYRKTFFNRDLVYSTIDKSEINSYFYKAGISKELYNNEKLLTEKLVNILKDYENLDQNLKGISLKGKSTFSFPPNVKKIFDDAYNLCDIFCFKNIVDHSIVPRILKILLDIPVLNNQLCYRIIMRLSFNFIQVYHKYHNKKHSNFIKAFLSKIDEVNDTFKIKEFFLPIELENYKKEVTKIKNST